MAGPHRGRGHACRYGGPFREAPAAHVRAGFPPRDRLAAGQHGVRSAPVRVRDGRHLRHCADLCRTARARRRTAGERIPARDRWRTGGLRHRAAGSSAVGGVRILGRDRGGARVAPRPGGDRRVTPRGDPHLRRSGGGSQLFRRRRGADDHDPADPHLCGTRLDPRHAASPARRGDGAGCHALGDDPTRGAAFRARRHLRRHHPGAVARDR